MSMKQLILCGYEGPISIDHAFRGYPSTGGMIGSFAYPTGHMKGMIYAIEHELAPASDYSAAAGSPSGK